MSCSGTLVCCICPKAFCRIIKYPVVCHVPLHPYHFLLIL